MIEKGNGWRRKGGEGERRRLSAERELQRRARKLVEKFQREARRKKEEK
jgi:hypothetical protein